MVLIPLFSVLADFIQSIRSISGPSSSVLILEGNLESLRAIITASIAVFRVEIVLGLSCNVLYITMAHMMPLRDLKVRLPV